MNRYQTMQVRRQVMRALCQAGAMHATVTRVEKDLNGMPTGETVTVCTLYGLKYQRKSFAQQLVIDVPGVTLSGDVAPHVCGVIVHGGMPQAGDVLLWEDEKLDIVRAGERFGVLDVVLAK